MHQKYLEPLSCKEGALALFSRSTEPIPKTILLWFSRAFLRVASGFQTPAREAGWVKVHGMGACVWVLGMREARVYSEFPEAQFQKLGEPGSNAQKHKERKKKTHFSVFSQGMRSLPPWDKSKLFFSLRHCLKLGKVRFGKSLFTSVMGETRSWHWSVLNLIRFS